jgi:myosin heavy subunit
MCLNMQAQMPVPNRFGSTDIMDKLTTRTNAQPQATPEAAAADTAPTRAVSASVAALSGRNSAAQSSMQVSGKHTHVYPFSKCRESISKLLKAIDDTSNVTHICCVRPHTETNSRAMNPEYVAKQVKQLGLVDMAKFRRFGYSYSSKYGEFYTRFRVCAPFFHPRFPAAAAISSASVSKKETESLAKALLQVCLEQAMLVREVSSSRSPGHPNIVNATNTALGTGELIFGHTRIFMRESLIDELETVRTRRQGLLQHAAVCIQSLARMFVSKQRFTRVSVGVLSLQSFVRMHFCRQGFIAEKSAADKIKSVYRMHRNCRFYRRQRTAVGVLKRLLLTGLIQRVRFMRLQRAVRVAQSLSKSYIVRHMSDRVLHALTTLHTHARSFIASNRRFHRRRQAATQIQRLWRGCVFRDRNASVAYALQVRRNQRIVRVVVKKLQVTSHIC